MNEKTIGTRQRRREFVLRYHDVLAKALDRFGGKPDALLEESGLGEPEEGAEGLELAPGGMERSAAALREEQRYAVEEGLEGARRIVRGGEDPAMLTPAQEAGAEAIVRLTGRPAILISGDSFGTVPEEWAKLNEQKAGIEASIQGVGRIEVDGHPELEWIGTGFLVTDDAIITNRHVAQEFAQPGDNGAWELIEGITPRINFRAERTSIESTNFAITGIVGVHRRYDLALLQMGGPLDGGIVRAGQRPLPLPLTAAPDLSERQRVYVIGYPAMDSRRNDPVEMQRIFQRIYDVKRLQPGEISGRVSDRSVLFHDCSTLGGNSGSCVVDLETHRVVGLHFGGRYLEANQAVILSELRADPLLAKVDPTFA